MTGTLDHLVRLSDALDDNPDLPIEHRRIRRKDKLDHGKKRCTKCRFRIRGPNHEMGQHHIAGGMSNVIR
jgi:hypothetical protein